MNSKISPIAIEFQYLKFSENLSFGITQTHPTFLTIFLKSQARLKYRNAIISNLHKSYWDLSHLCAVLLNLINL